MSEADNEIIKTVDHKPHAAFFRQSGWLVISGIVGGAMMYGVHFLAKSIPESQYAIFGTLLMVVACLPTMPLQMVFAQQTALALATGRERQLAGMLKLAWLWTFIVWALGALMVLVFQKQIVAGWHLPDARGLWVTLPLLLAALWLPMFSGVVQGRQDFFWLGWMQIFGGAGRFIAAAILVLALGFGAVGMMAGALLGVGFSAWIVIWRSRDLWSLPSEKFDGKSLMKQVVPLDVRVWRVPVHVHFGHDVCEGVFYGRPDGAIRRGGNAVAGAALARAAAGGGDVSENRPRGGNI